MTGDDNLKRSACEQGGIMGKSRTFKFDGGAADYLGTAILAFLVTLFTLGIALPYAIVLRQRWRAKHTIIDGQRLAFLGTGVSLFGNWVKWLLLIIVTLGIYSFWVAPRLVKWVVENTDFAQSREAPVVERTRTVAAVQRPPAPRRAAPRRKTSCPTCGEQTLPSAQFCGSCGAPLAV